MYKTFSFFFGPYPTGIIGSAAWVLLTLAILLKPGALDASQVKPLQVDEAIGERTA